MPRISKAKKEKISEQILSYLFEISPNSAYTNKIAESLARDEEFTKLILINLQKQGLIVPIDKNSQGIKYLRRQRWRLSNEAYSVYKQHQNTIDKKVTPQNLSNMDEDIDF